MIESIKEVLMRRDDLTGAEADDLITEAKEEFYRMIEEGEDPSGICQDFFRLDPDYLNEFFQ